jgi:hypothetical protein
MAERSYRSSAVAFLHIPKTGGTSMRTWFAKNVEFALLGYNDFRCFFYLHRDVFAAYANSSSACDRIKNVKRVSLDRLHRLPLAIEFHVWSEWRFWHEMMPRVPELRKRYALHGGTFLATTLIREPRAHIVSAFLEGKAKVRNASSGERQPMPFLQWLRSGTRPGDVSPYNLPSGIQTRSLACKHPSQLGCAYAPPEQSDGDLCNTSLAMANLRRMDLVCDVSHMSQFCRRVAERTSTPARAAEYLRRSVDSKVRASAIEGLRTDQPAEQVALGRAAKCDEQLMAIVPRGGGCWEGTDRLGRMRTE